jgi:hypothetical protein
VAGIADSHGRHAVVASPIGCQAGGIPHLPVTDPVLAIKGDSCSLVVNELEARRWIDTTPVQTVKVEGQAKETVRADTPRFSDAKEQGSPGRRAFGEPGGK